MNCFAHPETSAVAHCTDARHLVTNGDQMLAALNNTIIGDNNFFGSQNRR